MNNILIIKSVYLIKTLRQFIQDIRQNRAAIQKTEADEIRLVQVVSLTCSLLDKQVNMLLDKLVNILHKNLRKLQNDQRLLQYHNVKL